VNASFFRLTQREKEFSFLRHGGEVQLSSLTKKSLETGFRGAALPHQRFRPLPFFRMNEEVFPARMRAERLFSREDVFKPNISPLRCRLLASASAFPPPLLHSSETRVLRLLSLVEGFFPLDQGKEDETYSQKQAPLFSRPASGPGLPSSRAFSLFPFPGMAYL